MAAIQIVEVCLFLFMTLTYFYQIVYLVYMLFVGKKKLTPVAENPVNHRFGIVIAARNEEKVIGQLIDSVHKQNYPSELVRIYVIADNCTDSTADICRNLGATVLVRNSTTEIGKGYALNYLFKTLEQEQDDFAEAFIVLDADNLLDKNYIYEMNNVLCLGYRVSTSYRNSKNYGTNWISAGTSLWFLREAEYLNNARMQLGTSCAISGTGFMLRRDVVCENGGWPYYLLTEDLQFTTANVLRGEKIGYAARAVLYDEQPVTFSQSWRQRMRWAKGFYQVMWHYGAKLFWAFLSKGMFSCYDILMTIFPSIFVTAGSLVCFIWKIIEALCVEQSTRTALGIVGQTVFFCAIFYLFVFSFGIITVITEWNKIGTTTEKKIRYAFTFPIFLFTYIPIGACALFKKVEWKPINHSISITVDELADTDKEKN